MRILTLTANLLAETTCTYARWTEGGTHRASEETFQVGGKGINVSRMLRRLGVETEALCFPGGAEGTRCEAWMRDAAIPFRAFRTAHETRAGWVVRAPGRTETTFLGADNKIDARAIGECAAFLDATVASDANTCLAICGSIPGWHDASWKTVRAAIECWAGHAPIVVDTYGEALAWFARLPCAMVKINRKEFSGLAGVPQAEADDARMPALLERTATQNAVARWVITDGGGTVWSFERGGGTRPLSISPPKIAEVSPTGSGDVLFAALVEACLVRGRSLATGLEFALPLAAANAASPGVADFDLAPFGLVDRSG